MVKIRRVDAQACQLGENSYWNPSDLRFYYCDILAGNVYSVGFAGGKARLELATDHLIGAFEFNRNGDLVLFTEKGICVASRDPSGTFHLARGMRIPFDFIEKERFNDAIVDPEGRILAGSKREDNVGGRLYSIGVDGSVRSLLEGLKISNGMGFSPDAAHLYHTESVDKQIRCYDYDLATGDISNGRVLIDSFPKGGEPDGMAVDVDGNIWTACWGSCAVCEYDPQGRLLREVRLPAKYVSCVAFGGPEMDMLFVTSAACCLDKIEENDGKCFIIEGLGAKGRIENLAD